MTVTALRRLLAEIDRQGGSAAARGDRLVLPGLATEAAAIRAWAAARGLDCPRTGSLPRRVVEAWQAGREGV